MTHQPQEQGLPRDRHRPLQAGAGAAALGPAARTQCPQTLGQTHIIPGGEGRREGGKEEGREIQIFLLNLSNVKTLSPVAVSISYILF